jgi:hypothetical protein
MNTNFCWKKNQILEQKQPPMQPCTPIILHSDMKSLKTPDSVVTPQYP